MLIEHSSCNDDGFVRGTSMITTDTVSSNSRMNPSKLNVLNAPSVAKTTGVISGSGNYSYS